MKQTNQGEKIKFLILVGLLKRTDYNAKIIEMED